MGCLEMMRAAMPSGGDNEVQRTMLEIVNQLDGFDSRGNIKVLMATNRPDTLDPALLRPGRLDRKAGFDNDWHSECAMHSQLVHEHQHDCILHVQGQVDTALLSAKVSTCVPQCFMYSMLYISRFSAKSARHFC